MRRHIIATNPLLLAGSGRVGGSLNLGPISIGIDAQIEFVLDAEQDFYLSRGSAAAATLGIVATYLSADPLG